MNLDRRLVALKALKPRSRSTAEERQRALEILRISTGKSKKAFPRSIPGAMACRNHWSK